MEIYINNILWKIKLVKSHNSNLYRNDGSLTIGMTDNNKCTIYINENLDGEILYKVLCHELCHAFVYSYNIILSNEMEELLSDFISSYGKTILECTDEIAGKIIKEKMLKKII